MQNFTKSQTRLAFIQYIFQSDFINENLIETKNDFESHFHNSNIQIMGEKKVFRLKFNKTFFNKLTNNYITKFNKNKVIKKIDSHIDFNRAFQKWDKIMQSLILAIISELEITNKDKVKIVLSDYLNISKTLVSNKEISMINALIQKFIDEKTH